MIQKETMKLLEKQDTINSKNQLYEQLTGFERYENAVFMSNWWNTTSFFLVQSYKKHKGRKCFKKSWWWRQGQRAVQRVEY